MKSIKWHLLNPAFSISYSNFRSNNYCWKLGPTQEIPEVNWPMNMLWWKQLVKTKLTGWRTSPPIVDCNFRSVYPMLRQKPWLSAWLIWRSLLTSWGGRYMASPWMNRSASRRNYPSTWSCLKLGGRLLHSGALENHWAMWNTQQICKDESCEPYIRLNMANGFGWNFYLGIY